MGLFKNKEPTVLIRVTDFERRIESIMDKAAIADISKSKKSYEER